MRIGSLLAVTFSVSLMLGCKAHTLGPDEVDLSVPKPTSPNEPAGFTPVANRAFSALDEDNWTWGGIQDSYKEMSDQAAPESPAGIGRITQPQGFAAGGSPIRLERNIKPSDHVYLNAYFRLSANYEINSIADALVSLWAGDQPHVFWGWRVDSTGTGIHPTALVSTTKVQGGSLWLDANIVKDVTISKGGWHHVEVELESAAGTSGLGRYVCWLDGTKIASYDDVPFGLVEQGKHWDIVQLGAAWGGITKPLDQTQYIELDHVYMSDKPL
jgi:hypothetical protein